MFPHDFILLASSWANVLKKCIHLSQRLDVFNVKTTHGYHLHLSTNS